MYCPLCKAEFRDGFLQCSDCHLRLVATKEEAERQSVTRVWRGGKSELESVLSALQEVEIPSIFQERSNVGFAIRSSLLGLAVGRRNDPNDTEFEVRVLGSDAERAQLTISPDL
jgi:hypothetical protein